MSSSSSVKSSPAQKSMYISESESGIEASASSVADEEDSVMGVTCGQIPPQLPLEQTVVHRGMTGSGTSHNTGIGVGAGRHYAISTTSSPPPQSPTRAFNTTFPYSISSTSSLSDQERHQGGIPTPSSGYEGDTEGGPTSDLITAGQKDQPPLQRHIPQQQQPQQAEHGPPQRSHERQHCHHNYKDYKDSID
ncbi:hypothetical protein BCR43DRAFT_491987, partial [Syncephalastrum racemosum]